MRNLFSTIFLMTCFLFSSSFNSQAQNETTTRISCIDANCNGQCDSNEVKGTSTNSCIAYCIDSNNNDICDNHEKKLPTKHILNTQQVGVGIIDPDCKGCEDPDYMRITNPLLKYKTKLPLRVIDPSKVPTMPNPK